MKWSQLTFFSKSLISLVVAGLVGAGVYFLAPGLKVSESKQLESIDVSDGEINNVITSKEEVLPSKGVSSKVSNQPLIKIAGYAWNAQSGIIVANGGPKTTSGSLMEKNNINLELVRQDWLSELRNLQMKFIEEFDNGNPFPQNGAAAIMIMGDGVPFYISSAQQAIDEKYGKGKYQLQVMGAIGLSNGEDKLIGPLSWKLNPKSMKGSLISAVIGDGDWVTTVNYAFANGLKVNPDPTTYDAEAVNFLASANDDYIESAKELIKSQNNGWTIPLKEVVGGKLTGKTINKKVDGCATWTPGDKMVFDALSGFTDIISTKEFNNQMATSVIFVKQWAEKNREKVVNIFKATYTATNQMKQYDTWRRRAAEAATDNFGMEDANYWYNMFKGQSAEKNGIPYNMGGSKVLNLADVKQYYGMSDGINRYKAVYDQVSKYLKILNPAGFNENVDRVVPYDEAVNTSFIQGIGNIDAGVTSQANYSEKATTLMAAGEWQINFESGRAMLRPDGKDLLDQVFNLLVQAENSKIELVGHTDNDGNRDSNYSLSIARAEAVKTFLIQKGIPATRFQKVDGKGQDVPVEDNSTPAGKARNRRVEVRIMK